MKYDKLILVMKVNGHGSFLPCFTLSEGLRDIGLGISCNFMIDNQLQPTDRLSIKTVYSHFFSKCVLEV